ncbi:MAG: tRNA (adenosine(37)-N6)-dimethylallyltransferase MiaA [Cellvibrionaceae bacterium]
MSSNTPLSSRRPPVVFLMGPTAVGKTAVAMALREQLPLDLISVDSTQVYRGLDIGSAKPSAEDLARAPHRLIDIRDPASPYSAADFRRDASLAIADIQGRGRIPCLVGGTMLYFKVLLHGLAELPGADPALRAEIEAEAKREGWPELHRRLATVDPETAARLHPNHSQRILRALEVYRLSGETMSALQKQQINEPGDAFDRCHRVIQLAVLPHNRTLLHERIAARFDAMLQAGFEQEVRALFARGDLSPDLPAIRAVGYRQMWDYLAGHCSREEMIDRGVAATRQLAKRQLTWLRNWTGLGRLYIDTPQGREINIVEIRDRALNYIERMTI